MCSVLLCCGVQEAVEIRCRAYRSLAVAEVAWIQVAAVVQYAASDWSVVLIGFLIWSLGHGEWILVLPLA